MNGQDINNINQSSNNSDISDSANSVFDFDVDGVASIVGASHFNDESKANKIFITKRQKKQLKKQYKAKLHDLKKGMKDDGRQLRKVEKLQRLQGKSITEQLKARDRSLSKITKNIKRKRRNANNVVDFIGYENMFRDGICEVEKGIFSQTLKFPDISYQSSREDFQKDVFRIMCAIYNYFGPNVSVQFSVINSKLRSEEIGTRKFFNEEEQSTLQGKKDAILFNKILNQKMKEGISNIKRNRYLTFSVAAQDVDAVMPLLARIRNDVSGYLSKIGCTPEPLDGYERLKVIHDIMNPDKPFVFDYDRDLTVGSFYTTKDAVSPSAFDFAPMHKNDCFKIDEK